LAIQPYHTASHCESGENSASYVSGECAGARLVQASIAIKP
jgi:hypothetical protein